MRFILTFILFIRLILVSPEQVEFFTTQELRDLRIEQICAGQHEFQEAVARWCPLVAEHFPRAWVHWALHTIWCESRGDPDANLEKPWRSHKGLFQHSTRYWEGRARKAGWPGASIYDPEANIAVSKWLLLDARGGGLSHWTCKARHAVP